VDAAPLWRPRQRKVRARAEISPLMGRHYLVPILAMPLAIAAGINVISGGIYISKKETEIAPGLIWKYYSDNYSRLFWNGHGMVAEGPLILTFCDYGLCVGSPEDRRIRNPLESF